MTQALVISRRGDPVRGLVLGSLGSETEVRVVEDPIAATRLEGTLPSLVVVDLVDLPRAQWGELDPLRVRLPHPGLVAIVPARGRGLRRALRAGVDALLLDPFDLGQVQATLRTTLRRIEASAGGPPDEEPDPADPIEVLARFLKGLAHEVNNPLASILGILQVIQADNQDEVLETRYSTVRRELERIQVTVKELELFVRVRKPRRRLLDLIPLLEGLRERSSVALQLQLPPSPASIQLLGDSEQLESCLLRLVELAAGEVGGRAELSATTGHGKVRISIYGSPPSIPESPMDLFLPYQGSHHDYLDSLRRAAAHGIVLGHQGDLVARRDGEGLSLELELPCALPDVPEAD